MTTLLDLASRLKIVALATALAIMGATASAEYRLAAGDRVRVAALGAPEISGEVDVDVDGHVRLPVFGAVKAVGLTVDELQQALRSSIEGRVFRRLAGDGSANFATVEPEDVYLTVAAYRPIYVVGAVNRGGGVVAFRPGMTVRSAIASVGGVGEEAAGVNPALASPRLRSEERTLSYEVARLVAELWRLEAEYAEDSEPPPPDPQAVPVRESVFEALMENQSERLKTALNVTRERRNFFEVAQNAARERLNILKAQQQNQLTAAEFDSEEQERVETLFQRGVVPVARLLDTRRAQLLSSSRLLETENNLERVNVEIINLVSNAQLYEEERNQGLLAALDDTRARLGATSARLSAIREELSLAGQAILDLDVAEKATVIISVYRDGVAMADVSPDLAILPGDTIEVLVEPFDPMTATP